MLTLFRAPATCKVSLARILTHSGGVNLTTGPRDSASRGIPDIDSLQLGISFFLAPDSDPGLLEAVAVAVAFAVAVAVAVTFAVAVNVYYKYTGILKRKNIYCAKRHPLPRAV
jgi:hypothetical protein